LVAQSAPTDQRILDAFFDLLSRPGLKRTAWLLGMVAVFGLQPEDLEGFSWNEDNTINVTSKKRPVRPLHPQWVFILQLKEQKLRKGEIPKLEKSFLTSSPIDMRGLILAHKMRKVLYTPVKMKRTE
jgi:hypothetical protein